MTGLKEFVVKKAEEALTGKTAKIYEQVDTVLFGNWTESYIRELEEHINEKANQYNIETLKGYLACRNEVLRFLRGETN